MVYQFQATFEDGVLRPNEPLALPDHSLVDVTAIPRSESATDAVDDEDEVRPETPQLTVSEFRRILSEHSVSVGTLPVDFDRHDIYADHD